jgi:ABC-type phosphate/phosphonate transport system substrate-binding protein
MTAIAHLPMYDLPEVARAADDVWSAIATRLRDRGLRDVPLGLARDMTHHESWCHPRLLLGQSCGYPALNEFRGRLRIVATPIHDASGCEGTQHCSFILVPVDAPWRALADLRGARFALNSWDSNTGMNLPRLAFAPFASRGRFFGEIIETGSHAASLSLVVERRADAAAIDCVTHALLMRHRPALVAGARILALSAKSPALPFVTAGSASEATVQVLRDALVSALTEPTLAPSLKTLFLVGVAPAAEEDYRILRDYEERARELGYPRLN